MSNRNVPFFRDYLRVLDACVSYAETSRRLAISEDWVFKNLAASKAASATPDQPSVFLFEAEPGDGEPRWFHDHVRSAVTNSIEQIEAAARGRAFHGTYTTAKFQGATVYKINPDWLDEDMRDLLSLGDGDKYLRVNGQLVPEQVWTPPSTDLVLGILAAHSKRYRKQSSVSIDMQARVSGGVQVISNKPAPQLALPVVEIVEAIEEPERVPVDEEPPADFAEIDDAEVEPDNVPDLRVTDTAPTTPGNEPEVAEPPTPPATAASYSVPTPPEYVSGPNPLISPRGGRPLSDLERDLLSKLPSSLNRK